MDLTLMREDRGAVPSKDRQSRLGRESSSKSTCVISIMMTATGLQGYLGTTNLGFVERREGIA